MTLYAGIPDSLGPGNYQASFAVTDPSTSATVDQGTVASSAGTDAVFVVRQNVLDAAAAGTITEFSWNVTLSNGTAISGRRLFRRRGDNRHAEACRRWSRPAMSFWWL